MSALRLNISLDRRLVRRIDAAADALGMTRSAYLAAAARAQLDRDFRASYAVRRAITTLQEQEDR